MKTGKNQQVILRLIDAVSDNDKERILSFLSDDTVIYTSPDQSTVGQSAIWELISAVHADADKIDWQVDHLVEDESGRVSTRGCLRYCINGRWSELPVNGAFKIRGSKITQWC
jgi:limonene-1,2-epoxide hydrolase